MADIETLKRSLLNAHNAGDEKAARVLARAIKRETKAANATSTTEDVVKSTGAGIARGTADLVGLPGTIGDALKGAVSRGLSKGYELATGEVPRYEDGGIERFFAADAPPEVKDRIKSPFAGEAMQGYASAVTGGGSDYEPQTTAGKYARTVGEFLPGAAAFGGMSPSNLTRFGAIPGATSESAGQLTEGTAAEPYARFAGALAGGVLPGVVSRTVTPLPSNATREQMAKYLRNEGIDLTAGQRTGSTRTRYSESALNQNAAQDFVERQAQQFTSAALKRIGVQAERATPEVMENAYQTIGQQFDDLASRYGIPGDRQLFTDLRNIRGKYQRDVPTTARTGTMDDALKDITDRIQQSGALDGRQYANLRSELGSVARSQMGSNPQTSRALMDVVEALDDAMERSIRVFNPDDVGAWKEARRLYRNFLVVERAAAGSGENAAMGLISPSQLRNATKQLHGVRNYTQGKGDFADLVRAGEGLMKPLPQSGTAPRLSASIPGGLGAGIGAGLGHQIGDIQGAIVGAAAGATVPSALGRLMLSGPGRAYLGNQALPGARVLDPALTPLSAEWASRTLPGQQQRR